MLEPGTRIVSNRFGMGEWNEEGIATVGKAPVAFIPPNRSTPDYAGEKYFSSGARNMIYLWQVPAAIAGRTAPCPPRPRRPKDSCRRQSWPPAADAGRRRRQR